MEAYVDVRPLSSPWPLHANHYRFFASLIICPLWPKVGDAIGDVLLTGHGCSNCTRPSYHWFSHGVSPFLVTSVRGLEPRFAFTSLIFLLRIVCSLHVFPSFPWSHRVGSHFLVGCAAWVVFTSCSRVVVAFLRCCDGFLTLLPVIVLVDFLENSARSG